MTQLAISLAGKRGVTVFTKSTTEAINMVAAGLDWQPGDQGVTTIVEHHSNLLRATTTLAISIGEQSGLTIIGFVRRSQNEHLHRRVKGSGIRNMLDLLKSLISVWQDIQDSSSLLTLSFFRSTVFRLSADFASAL